MAIAALVLGIASLVFSVIGFITAGALYWAAFLGFVLAIVGLVISCVAKKKGASGKATAGLVCSIVALVLGTLASACSVCWIYEAARLGLI